MLSNKVMQYEEERIFFLNVGHQEEQNSYTSFEMKYVNQQNIHKGTLGETEHPS